MQCKENPAVDPFFDPRAIEVCAMALANDPEKLPCGPESVFLALHGESSFTCDDVPKMEFKGNYDAPKKRAHSDKPNEAVFPASLAELIPQKKSVPHNECEQDMRGGGCDCFCTVMRTVRSFVNRLNGHLSESAEKIKIAMQKGDVKRFPIVPRDSRKVNEHVEQIDAMSSRMALSYILCMTASGFIVPLGVSYWSSERRNVSNHWFFASGYQMFSADGGVRIELYAHDVGRNFSHAQGEDLSAEEYLEAISKNQHVTLYVDENGGRIYKPGDHHGKPISASGYDVTAIGIPYLPMAEPST